LFFGILSRVGSRSIFEYFEKPLSHGWKREGTVSKTATLLLATALRKVKARKGKGQVGGSLLERIKW
jgi:hypothetical protein